MCRREEADFSVCYRADMMSDEVVVRSIGYMAECRLSSLGSALHERQSACKM